MASQNEPKVSFTSFQIQTVLYCLRWKEVKKDSDWHIEDYFFLRYCYHDIFGINLKLVRARKRMILKQAFHQSAATFHPFCGARSYITIYCRLICSFCFNLHYLILYHRLICPSCVNLRYRTIYELHWCCWSNHFLQQLFTRPVPESTESRSPVFQHRAIC